MATIIAKMAGLIGKIVRSANLRKLEPTLNLHLAKGGGLREKGAGLREKRRRLLRKKYHKIIGLGGANRQVGRSKPALSLDFYARCE